MTERMRKRNPERDEQRKSGRAADAVRPKSVVWYLFNCIDRFEHGVADLPVDLFGLFRGILLRVEVELDLRLGSGRTHCEPGAVLEEEPKHVGGRNVFIAVLVVDDLCHTIARDRIPGGRMRGPCRLSQQTSPGALCRKEDQTGHCPSCA